MKYQSAQYGILNTVKLIIEAIPKRKLITLYNPITDTLKFVVRDNDEYRLYEYDSDSYIKPLGAITLGKLTILLEAKGYVPISSKSFSSLKQDFFVYYPTIRL